MSVGSSMYLPNFLVLSCNGSYVHCPVDAANSEVSAGGDHSRNPEGEGAEWSVHSTLVKMQAERSDINPKYVHIRCCYTNKYWEVTGGELVAVSMKTEEDTSKPSCTLFEPLKASGGGASIQLKHVQSGGLLMFVISSGAIYCHTSAHTVTSPDVTFQVSYVNWETLVKLPERVAFQGRNGKYLHAYYDSAALLKFVGDDLYNPLAGHRVTARPNGQICISSDHFGKYWCRDPAEANNWIKANNQQPDSSQNNAFFIPIKIDSTTIALKNVGNNSFCRRLTEEPNESCLSASSATMVAESRLVVKELISTRKIYNVRYRMESARIYDETHFVAGKTNVMNYSDQEGNMEVTISYTEESSYTFSNSVSVTAGVSATMSAGIPLIGETSITVSLEATAAFEWNRTTTKSFTTEAKTAVPVPPKSVAQVSYVGVKGVCDIPFSYTWEDTSATDGTVYEQEHIDGVFKGVNCYNYSFVIEKVRPLAGAESTKPALFG